MKIYILIVLFTANLFSQSNQRGEILSETPLYPLPENMTFEEYQDINRRMSIGVGLAFIPIPGIVHRYAGEKEVAKRLTYISIGGFISLIGSLSNSSIPSKAEFNQSMLISSMVSIVLVKISSF